MPRNYPKNRASHTILTEEVRKELTKIGYARAGVTYPQLATRFGVSVSTIGSFIRKLKTSAESQEDQE